MSPTIHYPASSFALLYRKLKTDGESFTFDVTSWNAKGGQRSLQYWGGLEPSIVAMVCSHGNNNVKLAFWGTYSKESTFLIQIDWGIFFHHIWSRFWLTVWCHHLANRRFAWWRHLTTTTIILHSFCLLCLLEQLLFKSLRDFKI